ncbi:hypothetical protein IMSAG249_00496 [Lachnospiraceae bacterium]|nr:hypothetical protein IMSAG249_00496 [Lachnospiraceae bacterium]
MQNKKSFASFLIFFVLLVAVLLKCADLLENKQSRIKYTPFFESETNFDVIFMGTSHTYNSIFPQELWREYGITSYNWGYSNCTIVEDYYILQDVLKYTNPKLIVIDLYGLIEYENYGGYGNGKYRSDRIEQQHVQFDVIPLSLNKIKASQDIFDDYEGNIDFIANFFMYHNRWTELAEQDFNSDVSPEKGGQFLTGLGKNVCFNMIENDERMEIESVCYQYLLKLVDYCSINDIQVLCVYLPYPAEKGQQLVANSMEDLLKDYSNCRYINLLNREILNMTTDIFSDGGHLNYMGGCKVTSWIGQYISENYKINNYLNDSAYAIHWNNDYEDYLNYKIKNICNHDDIYEKLLLTYGTDFEIELSIAKECHVESEDTIISEFIKELVDNVSIVNVEEVYVKDIPCDIYLSIKCVENQEIIDSAGYTYENGVYTYIQ